MPHAIRRFFAGRNAIRAAVALLAVWGVALAAAQSIYHRPPRAILDVLNAPAPFQASVSPARDRMLLYTPVRFPEIGDLARPMLRLAGLRIDPANYGPHVPQRYRNWSLVDLATGTAHPLVLPAAVYAGAPLWSPDGRRFVFLDYAPRSVELWIGDAASGAVHRLGTFAVNAAIAASGFGGAPPGGGPVVWMPDSRHLLVRLVPAERGPAPPAPAVAAGPIVQEADADPSPVATFEDLLTSPHDEALFTYYATAQLALVDVASGATHLIGRPAIFATNAPSPDGRHLLIARIHKPYSYLVPQTEFPRQVEVWDLTGRRQYRLADLPLAEHTPIGGAPTGPRDEEWMPTAGATLVWVEALDHGDPRQAAPYRDRVMALPAPFAGAPAALAKTQDRFAGLAWGERGDLAILRAADRRTATVRTYFFDPRQAAPALRLVWTLNTRDQYGNPGQPAEIALANGQRAVAEDGGDIFLLGAGASPEGDRPFLDRFNVRTLRAERLFHCPTGVYERVVALLAPDGSRFLSERESPTAPPNYYARNGADAPRAVSHYADPTPIVRSIRSELVTYRRADGVPLSMTVYLPPDYKTGERRPAILWGYPSEFSNVRVAGEVTGSPYRFTGLTDPNLSAGGGVSPLYLLLDGYVVLNNAALPIVGPPRTVNDTFVTQLVADARAAIAQATAMGVIDPNRVAVAGHSYGAFMTANLMAHSDLFRAGCAQSGAYNRTLTPFGFQNERRTFWQAEATYEGMSPFFFADRLKAPILLIHGMADSNSGTFPIQSLRMYEALQGNGGTVRYVQLPYEAHGYIGRQSIEEVIWEMMTWFDKYVKNAPRPTAGQAS